MGVHHGAHFRVSKNLPRDNTLGKLRGIQHKDWVQTLNEMFAFQVGPYHL